MNAALIISRSPAQSGELSALLHGLGLSVEIVDVSAATQGVFRSPRVVVWVVEDADKDNAQNSVASALPATLVDAPITLRIAEQHATEAALLDALLRAGYDLPDDDECAAIPRVLHDLVDGDTAVVAELIDSLLDTARADLVDYRSRCVEADWAAVGHLAHRIKGTARLAGCASLTQLCERVEAAAQDEGGAALIRLNALFEPAQERLCAALGRLQRAT